jgi:hypothetical protein
MKTLKCFTLILFLFLVVCFDCPAQETNQVKTVLTTQPGSDMTFTFGNDLAGKLPVGWNAPTGKWTLSENEGKKILFQTAANNGNTFNIAVYEGAIYSDLELYVKIKAVSGKEDQGGGLVWRYIDSKNYYIVRENPLEDNVVLYKVQNGKRTDLPLIGKGMTYGVDVPKLGTGWNSLKVLVKRDLFVVYLNDKEIFQVKDQTFTKAGLIGVWSKADASSYFNEMVVKVK